MDRPPNYASISALAKLGDRMAVEVIEDIARDHIFADTSSTESVRKRVLEQQRRRQRGLAGSSSCAAASIRRFARNLEFKNAPGDLRQTKCQNH
jgi:hypothetical protein